MTIPTVAFAGSLSIPGLDVNIQGAENTNYASALKIVGILTVLSLAPAILMMVTAFARIIIVLSMLRHALGMPSTPPNTVIVSLALFLTYFAMAPVIDRLNTEVYVAYSNNEMTDDQALAKTSEILKLFMLKNTRESDISAMYDVSKKALPKEAIDVDLMTLIPAFMLSELHTAFKIGFVIFLPFLAVDLIVSSVLMALGLIMLPPTSISLPIKILMLVLIDGWTLVVQGLLSSFH